MTDDRRYRIVDPMEGARWHYCRVCEGTGRDFWARPSCRACEGKGGWWVVDTDDGRAEVDYDRPAPEPGGDT